MRRKSHHELRRELLTILRREGLQSAAELADQLDISQPSFSRLVSRMGDEVFVAGQARATRYACLRTVDTVELPVPLYRINASGQSQHVASLYCIEPEGYYLVSHVESLTSGYHESLPHYLTDLRPAGFLGRFLPQQHPQLLVPFDIRNWNDDHCLQYWTHHGFDLIGDLILGETAFNLHMQHAQSSASSLSYPEIAQDILQASAVGSSVAGEQPKFLARRHDDRCPVLVKFSPELNTATGQRIADLLVCEHLAHEVLKAHGIAAARSRILVANDRCFLEVERFDRVNTYGRVGLISLFALDVAEGGRLRSWREAGENLLERKRIDTELFQQLRLLACFGELIGNTDMHLGNISFIANFGKVTELAPVYDMLPMLYMPRHGYLTDDAFSMPTPQLQDADVWPQAWQMAQQFWSCVASDERISLSFRELACANKQAQISLEKIIDLLP